MRAAAVPRAVPHALGALLRAAGAVARGPGGGAIAKEARPARGRRAAAAASADGAPWSLYSRPALYDAVFGFRDFEAEVGEEVGGGVRPFFSSRARRRPPSLLQTAFVAAALAAHGARPALACFVDVGCGPGRHARAAAAAGCATVVGVDASRHMLAHAAAAASSEGLSSTWVEADLTSWSMPPGSPPADAALVALGTLCHALTDAAVDATLARLAAALAPGGVAVIELAAAEDVFDGALISGDAWDVPGGGGAGGGALAAPPVPALIVEYGDPDDAFDPVSQVLDRTVIVSQAAGDGARGAVLGREVVRQRVFTPGELRARAAAAGLAVAAELGDMDLGAGAEGGAGAYVLVLAKPVAS